VKEKNFYLVMEIVKILNASSLIKSLVRLRLDFVEIYLKFFNM